MCINEKQDAVFTSYLLLTELTFIPLFIYCADNIVHQYGIKNFKLKTIGTYSVSEDTF